ncbi:recombinase family protein [Roseovarius sp.]|uniref:recombinase family protein n=1 Tax=Roseovarius sp. TaxID=1486281 RepID=UPI003A983321
MRFAGYGRMSSDRQNPKSAEDQIFEIKAAGETNGWVFVRGYTDKAMSGSTIFGCTGLEELRRDASEGKFDCIIIEDVDRLSRNLGDLAKFVEYMAFYKVIIYSLSKGGFINEMDVGFKGTMSAQFLKDLRQKTRRGLAAAVRDGRSGGGLPCGYRLTVNPGVFEIDEERAEVVRRILQMYADGYSPREIAGALNEEGIPSPTGGQWNASSINGHKERGVGILRNEIYVGVRVWNRTEQVQNPETGTRQIRPKP